MPPAALIWAEVPIAERNSRTWSRVVPGPAQPVPVFT